MSKSSTSKEAVEDMIKSLETFKSMQDKMVENLKKQYERIGQDWNDEKYKELGDTLEDIYTPIEKCSDEVESCIKRIKVLEGNLDSYLNTRI